MIIIKKWLVINIMMHILNHYMNEMSCKDVIQIICERNDASKMLGF